MLNASRPAQFVPTPLNHESLAPSVRRLVGEPVEVDKWEHTRRAPMSGHGRVPPLLRQPYAHGGYMAMASTLWHEAPHWREALEQRDAPGIARLAIEIAHLPSAQRAARLIHHFENDPVVTAFGLLQHPPGLSGGIEWDVWLDPTHPADLDRAKVVHGGVVATLAARTPLARRVPYLLLSAAPSPSCWRRAYEDAIRAHAPAEEEYLTPPHLYLDIKSTYSTAHDIGCFIDALQEWWSGLEVRGVGSFDISQLEEPLDVPDKIAFFHSFGGLRRACESGRLRSGQAAMFNASFLLKAAGGTRPGYAVDGNALRRVESLQHTHPLRLGFYTQEYNASANAIHTLIACANAHPDIFPLGFAYGGIDTFADGDVEGRGVANQTPAAWAEERGCAVM